MNAQSRSNAWWLGLIASEDRDLLYSSVKTECRGAKHFLNREQPPYSCVSSCAPNACSSRSNLARGQSRSSSNRKASNLRLSVASRWAAPAMSSSETFSSRAQSVPPNPVNKNSLDNGTAGCELTGAPTQRSRTRGITNAPVRHIPMAPTRE
jgi:hypothetical protein